MSSNYCFPTIGELVKFIYEISSILSDKNDPEAVTQKKTFQKSIQRLSKEEGELEKNYFSSMEQYLKKFHQYIGCRRSADALAGLFQDVFAVYKSVIKSDGVFLIKKENIKWFIDSYLITRVVLSTHKQHLRFNIAEEKYNYPRDEFWFLPKVAQEGTKEKIRWPLSIALEWIYEITSTTQTRFHYPDKSKRSENLIQKRNFENANKWSNNQSNPTWNDLHTNITTSFEVLKLSNNSISLSKRTNILLILFIAHVSTNVGKRILKEYGMSYLKSVLERYKEYSEYIKKDNNEIKEEIEKVQSLKNGKLLNTLERDRLCLELVPHYWRYQADISQEFAVIYQQYIFNNKKPSEEIMNEWCQSYSEFLVKTSIKDVDTSGKVVPPILLFTLTKDGLSLINRYEPQKYEKFIADLEASDFNEVLKWLLLWVKAERCLIQKKPEEAFKLYEKAFEEAKYAIGNKQYKLVNKFLSTCAKQDKYQQFKKAMAWAYFIGIDIQIIRGIESFDYQNSEHMKFAFNFFKKANFIN